MSQVTIVADDPAQPHVRQLIEALDEFLTSLYPPESNHLLPIDALRQPNVTFLSARLRERVIGCGALVNHDGEYGELKRSFAGCKSGGESWRSWNRGRGRRTCD
jgi:putative acetyltransferase